MDLEDIEVGRKYKCDYGSAQYFAIVVRKDDKRVCVTLEDKVNDDGDPGDPTDRLGVLGERWVDPKDIHSM